MPQYANDVLARVEGVLNIGGDLVKFTGVAQGGGDLVAYDSMPVGGPPSANYYQDVRAPVTIDLTCPIPGADETAWNTFLDRFMAGSAGLGVGAKTFDVVASPSTTGQMMIIGLTDMIGRQFTVSSRPKINVQYQQNAELSVTLTESGDTA